MNKFQIKVEGAAEITHITGFYSSMCEPCCTVEDLQRVQDAGGRIPEFNQRGYIGMCTVVLTRDKRFGWAL